MAGEANLTTSAAILKTKYTQPKVYWIAYKENPEYAEVKKDTSFDGANKVIAVQTETPQGAGTTIAAAQAAAAAGVYKNFLITRIEDFAIARVKGQAMRAAQKNTGALIDLWTREMDGALHNNTRSAAISFWRSGTGTRGVATTISTVTISLGTPGNIMDVTNFAVGMPIQLTATDGAAPRAGTATITGIDRTAGTLTFGSNVTALIPGATNGDFVIRANDAVGAVNAGLNSVMTGVQGWVPPSGSRPVSNDSFFGLNRFSDPTRLAGQYLDGTGVPMQEVLLEAIAMTSVEGAKIDRIYMHTRDRANLVKELGAKVIYQKQVVKIPGSNASVGFKAMEFESDNGTALVMSSINVPRGKAFVTQWDTWTLESLGPCPQLLDFDNAEFLRIANDDSYEARVGYYGQISNLAPAMTCHVSNFGV